MMFSTGLSAISKTRYLQRYRGQNDMNKLIKLQPVRISPSSALETGLFASYTKGIRWTAIQELNIARCVIKTRETNQHMNTAVHFCSGCVNVLSTGGVYLIYGGCTNLKSMTTASGLADKKDKGHSGHASFMEMVSDRQTCHTFCTERQTDLQTPSVIKSDRKKQRPRLIRRDWQAITRTHRGHVTSTLWDNSQTPFTPSHSHTSFTGNDKTRGDAAFIKAGRHRRHTSSNQKWCHLKSDIHKKIWSDWHRSHASQVLLKGHTYFLGTKTRLRSFLAILFHHTKEFYPNIYSIMTRDVNNMTIMYLNLRGKLGLMKLASMSCRTHTIWVIPCFSSIES